MTASDTGFLVLHALRLKGFADSGVIAERVGLDDHDDVVRHLEKATGAGQVTRREGRISGWALTPEGRARHRQLVAEEVAAAGAEDAIRDAYRRFLAVNNELLSVCTAWQLKDGGLNDHSDPEYDRGVITRLAAIDAAVQPVCADLAVALQRFQGYGPRLAAALARVEGGDGDWFAKPMIDSYHTVWFELHEDLLTTLGIERSKEEGGAAS